MATGAPRFIMGSETEFGLIPRGGNWGDQEGRRRIIYFLGNLRKLLEWCERGSVESEISTVNKIVNWWDENLDRTEERGSPQSGSAVQEALRRLGLTGSRPPSGARLYIDMWHPESSTPECFTPQEVIAYERAGEHLMYIAAQKVAHGLEVEVDLLKRNWNPSSDTSYACHENYLLSRKLFETLVDDRVTNFQQDVWLFHLATRMIFTGSGRLDAREPWPDAFSLSQRQPFINRYMTDDTTSHRALINTRNRPYADTRLWGRLHVITGDSNRCDVSNFIKYGVSRLVLLMLEDFPRYSFSNEYYCLANPLAAFRNVAGPETLLESESAKTVTALDGQKMLYETVTGWLAWRGLEHDSSCSWMFEVMAKWRMVLEMVESSDDLLTQQLDVYVKKLLFENCIARGGSVKELRGLDYNYHLVGPKSLFSHLEGQGLVDALVSTREVERAMNEPPKTRAALRGLLTSLLSEKIVYQSWHVIKAEFERTSCVVEMPDPRFARGIILIKPVRRGYRVDTRLKRGEE